MTDDTETPGRASPAPFDPVTVRPAFIGVLVGLALAAASQTIVSTALPSIVGELGGYGSLSWVVSAYLLSSAVVMPFAGKLSDLHGAARVFRISIAVFAIGSLLAGASTSMAMLIVARVVQGLGGGSIMTVAFTVIARLVPARERGRYQSKVASVFAVTSVAGPLVGGFFVDQLSWRWAFFTITALCGVALAVVRNLPADGRRSDKGVDFVGAVLIVVIVVCLMLVAAWGGRQYAWDSAVIAALLFTVVVGSVGFTFWELRAPEPIVPVRLLRRRSVWTATVLGFFSGIAMFGVIVYAPTYLQLTLGATATQSGLLLVPLMACVLVASTVGGRVMSATGRYRHVAIAGSVLLAGGAGLLTTVGVDTPLALPSIYVGIVGLGIGATMPVTVVAAQNGVGVEHLGSVTSITQFTRKIGSTLGVAVLGAVFTAHVAGALDDAAAALPPGADPDSLLEAPAAINALPADLAAIVRSAVADGVTAAFMLAFIVALASVAVSLLLPDDELDDVEPGGGDTSVDLAP